MSENHSYDKQTVERRTLLKPVQQDPLKKREEFSISLRKKKKQEIIQSKRKRAVFYVDRPQ